MEGDSAAVLKYAADKTNTTIVSGSSDYSMISGLKDAILDLKTNYFSSTGNITIKGEKRDDLDRRFLLLEH